VPTTEAKVMAIRGLQQKKAALGGLLHNDLACVTVSREPQQGRLRPAVRHEVNASKTEDSYGPDGGLGGSIAGSRGFRRPKSGRL
jgi:hypothetical protein